MIMKIWIMIIMMIIIMNKTCELYQLNEMIYLILKDIIFK